MAKFINDLGYSNKNPFSPTREEKERMRLLKIQDQEFKARCLQPNTMSEPALNYYPENPILSRVSELPEGQPWVIEFTNTDRRPRDFELFNANVNYNITPGGFVANLSNVGEKNDYQEVVNFGDAVGVIGSEPPFNPERIELPPTEGQPTQYETVGPTFQEIMYEVIANPVIIKNIFFSGNWEVMTRNDLEIMYKDASGNFQLDKKRLMRDPYISAGNTTLDSPITVMIDGFASVKLKNIPPLETIRAIIYPNTNIQTIDCIGGWPEAMQL